jgi:alkylation response protein AidB-like acyl-CoA dehydrogenase
MPPNSPAAVATTSPPPESLLEAARRIAPLIRENAEKIHNDRELPRPVFEALADAGLFHMVVPRGIGGAELPLTEYVRVMEEIGRADASTGWAVNQGGTFGSFAARMQRDVARAIWIDTPRYVTGLLRDQPVVQFAVGKAEAALRSGRAFLMEAVGELWDEVSSTGALTLEKRALLRIASTHGIRLAEEVVDAVYRACGATAVFESHPIQRYFQDIHVITQHVQGRLSHYELVGQHWLGLQIDETRL